ncbi:MAG: Pyridoxal phosphate homeostasis protein [Gammaproteobacteria bacterium]|nr:Pyridoxal phosphate homeostasis protein [Gammaproteobacteria bacterium]
MTDIAVNLEKIRARIRQAEQQYHRPPGSVGLLAVSKSRSADEILSAMACGQREFGENYLQEAIPKMDALDAAEVRWHFIGPIQSNKCRAIAERFAWVHSLDRIKVAQRLNDMRPATAPPLNICIEVNISDESTKAGISPEDLPAFAVAINKLPHVRLRGLMAMPKPCSDFTGQRNAFQRLYECYAGLNAEGMQLDTLSMGTTDDMEAAIAEGSTMVRIGTAIFGPRPR